MKFVVRACSALVLAALFASVDFAQKHAVSPAEAEARQAPVKVFLDCINASCDSEFFRTDISFVDHVRDRKDADVHVLITAESTGGGGQKYTLNFIGLRRFAGLDHLFHYISKPAETSDELRRGLVQVIKMGLVHYVADSPVGSQLRITHVKPEGAAGANDLDRIPTTSAEARACAPES